MNICGYIPESVNEGDGLRAVIFISGCKHGCAGCFSRHTWSFQAGEPFTEKLQQQLIDEMKQNPLLDGITIAGGDPFFSAIEVSSFVQEVRQQLPHFSIWIYSGYTWEELNTSSTEGVQTLLNQCDILIDGPFVESQRDVSLRYRGSRNQRIIDIQQSAIQQKLILCQSSDTGYKSADITAMTTLT
ncbi:[Formate-C-acetyltransferase]-activating enzyme [Paenibacillus nuruki]|uniref:Anaerobic ribonucleoside-triphosphate reductase-activating protein n=1 Tax=Paenibacillus nuruki TaxID=1886670 RepID=A0A1E3KXX1_9BACL|nr:anaerobic ribonucleoside-triphosphate reductase activating protein [Paenibacillus nuruki]ODP26387.1 [Formate-C-acetyltransferase]-activating enzyme [Paenibacillus nuruki]